ncbi:toll/interleukin-1 receptor domain-containing protein [Alienimonas sp. DA493]|uniref:toll/interleukin-1 receptor domain-containing protein n=1 Tax=Alienimonas sp. DA493 TaxID=3373605 RepID=UPI0037553885
MSKPADSLNVLISHVAADEALAHRAAAALRRAGHQVWTGDEIYPGDNWAAKYAEALEQSDAMIPLLSPAALDSERVQSDLAFALGQKRYANRLIPVFTAGADPQSERFPWVLRRFPLVRMTDGADSEEAAFREVTAMLKDSAAGTSEANATLTAKTADAG